MNRRGREVYHSALRRTADRMPENNDLQVRDLTDDLVIRTTTGTVRPESAFLPQNRVEYRDLNQEPVPDGVLAVVRFGTDLPAPASPALHVDVGLRPLGGHPGIAELWRANGQVTAGATGAIRHASDRNSLFGVIEVDERDFHCLSAAAEFAYREILRFQQHSGFPHLLRMWNYLDGINDNSGDLERYRQFCLGRARALADMSGDYPAASGIGRQQVTHCLQVFWLASRAAVKVIENPRQISAYQYPREHGPASPSFSRAALTDDSTLFVSGTASIVGHLSRHHSDPLAQLDETLLNLQALNALPESQTDLLKVYVRNPAHAALIHQRLHAWSSPQQTLLLSADICRGELLLEIEAVKRLRSDATPSVSAT